MSTSSSDFNGAPLISVAIAFLTLTWVSLSLRCFVRLKITKLFEADDWFILIAQGVFCLSCSFILRGVHYGLGRHNSSLPQDNEIQALKYQALATLTYIADMMFIKLSIAIFLLRIAVQQRYIWVLKISIVIVVIWTVAIFFYDLFQCTPVEAQWDIRIQNPKCASGDSFVSAAYSLSVMSIVSDWLYALLPIPMIWSVRMTFTAKLTVSIVLSMGIFASIATLIRLRFLIDLADSSDNLYAMIWTLIEPGVAITAASLITIRPLLRAIHFPGFESHPYPSNRQ
ncbi:hypothetical protein G7Y89_g768 [Cudoniella acicularis]|uniref:Rhodopsin domain-containing protein n=1 Tax=Cudoniella acicularis TaxID=354080 RepID=A0A8H4RXK6_9HELO|nr:hypothetical protein G7Y89_g768 [Cudoniella acicularis]